MRKSTDAEIYTARADGWAAMSLRIQKSGKKEKGYTAHECEQFARENRQLAEQAKKEGK